MSVGIYAREWQPPSSTRRQREKHKTLCDKTCDCTKATTERTQVTCALCIKRMGDAASDTQLREAARAAQTTDAGMRNFEDRKPK